MTISRGCRTGKRRFRDIEAAKKAITRIRQTGVQRDTTPIRAYECPDCRWVHLSHLPVVPLARTSTLKPGKGLKRSGRLAPVSASRRAENPEYEAAKATVLLRDRGHCQAAELVPDVACGGVRDPHHVWAQGMYPERRTDPDVLITLCRQHHTWTHDHPIEARQLGLLQ